METELARRSDADKRPFMAMQVAIRAVVHHATGSSAGHASLEALSSQDPELFCDAAIAVLEEMPDNAERASACTKLCECPEFLIQLTRPERSSRQRLLELCRQFMKFDKRLDVHLADLLPRRHEDRYHLPPPVVARILDILNEISDGPRLVLLLNHLTDHPNPVVTEKAVVLMGRRICNAAWPQRHLQSSDPGVRAGAVEALWGRDTPAARSVMWGCVRDEHHRVAGNAILGLHRLGEAAVGELVTDMLDDDRPAFRSTAAKVMGEIGHPDFTEPLMRASMDNDAAVRLEAKRALVSIRQPILRQQQLEAESLRLAAELPAVETAVDIPVATPVEEPSEEPADDESWIHLSLDGKHTSTR